MGMALGLESSPLDETKKDDRLCSAPSVVFDIAETGAVLEYTGSLHSVESSRRPIHMPFVPSAELQLARRWVQRFLFVMTLGCDGRHFAIIKGCEITSEADAISGDLNRTLLVRRCIAACGSC